MFAALTAAGAVLLSRRRRPSRPAVPVIVVGPITTDPGTRAQILERAVFLSLELARVDGAVGAEELATIEQFLKTHLGPNSEKPSEIVSRVLRGTVYDEALAANVNEIRRLADDPHRELVLKMLHEVAVSDGPLVEAETAFLARARSRLGPRSAHDITPPLPNRASPR